MEGSRQGSDAPRNDILILPANLVAETADCAVLTARLQAQDTQSLRNHHLLHLVVRGRDALEDLEPLHRSGPSGRLVGDHATDGLIEDPGRCSEVERT